MIKQTFRPAETLNVRQISFNRRTVNLLNTKKVWDFLMPEN